MDDFGFSGCWFLWMVGFAPLSIYIIRSRYQVAKSNNYIMVNNKLVNINNKYSVIGNINIINNTLTV
jgi:hypothetical protein